MINAIIEYCAAHKGIVVTIVLVLTLAGVWSMRQINPVANDAKASCRRASSPNESLIH